MKELIKKIIQHYRCVDEDNLKKLISEFQIISFDMFDTLVTRDVLRPADMFSYVKKQYESQYGGITFNFEKERADAENRIRKKAKKEITISEIYTELESVTGTSCAVLMDIEKKCELQFAQARRDIKKLYDDCIHKEKKVYILSDMYLDKETIIAILNKCGYSNWTKLYLSSETGDTKRKGKLFQQFIDGEKIEPESVLHIGDAIKADYLIPKCYHIKSALLDNRKETYLFDKRNSVGLSEQEWLDYTALEAFLANRLQGIGDKSYILGYSVLGPVLYGFSKYLNEIVQAEKPDSLVFMAREGKMLKTAYERIFPDTSTPIMYLKTSRRSVAYTQLCRVETYSELLNTLPVKREENLQGLIELLRLDEEKTWDLLRAHGYTKQTPITAVIPEIFKPLITQAKEKANQQKDYLRHYLNEHNMQGNILVVDIGWRGTTQHYLTKFCDMYMPESDICLRGCYLGVLTDNKYLSFQHDWKRGYWFDSTHDERCGYMIATCRAVCELLFMPDEGSVVAYAEDKGHIVPQIDALEYSDSDIQKIQIVQRAAIDFIETFQKADVEDLIHITPKITLARFFKFGVMPTRESISYMDSFHYTESGSIYGFKVDRIWNYVRKPRKLKKDFINSPWKSGFARECIGMDLPYYKLIMWLRYMDQRRG